MSYVTLGKWPHLPEPPYAIDMIMFNIPPSSSHLLPIPLGSFLPPSYYSTTSMSSFMQLFAGIQGCSLFMIAMAIAYPEARFTALLHILFLLHIFCLVFQNGSWALGVWSHVSFGAKHSLVIHSHCFPQLWVSGFIVPHWKEKLLWPRVRVGIPSWAQWIQ